MIFRTDLALESRELSGTQNIDEVIFDEKKVEDIRVSKVQIKNERAASKLNKPIGTYITFEIPALTDDFRNMQTRVNVIADELKKLIPKEGPVLVIGVGNSSITPDALGPKSADSVLATRHISGELARSVGLHKLRPVAVLSPGVLGQTGIEVVELIKSLTEKLSPVAVIAIDALASVKTNRLGCTVQISDTGITPGSGIGNNRLTIDKNTLSVPVIGIGVPTVVDAATLAADLLGVSDEDEDEMQNFKNKLNSNGSPMMVTPREVDLLIDRASKLVSMSINCALHPDYSADDLAVLVS